MKMRRVIVTFEVETDATAEQLRRATIRVHTGTSKMTTIRYLEQTTVNVVRSSTAKRGKAKKESK